ncbi:MAG: 6-phosphofructokinase [Candidatus Thorarchaeota archaeon]|nr:6-phosphofructokinase [Candidatus Thorarchaeota archaeon]
MKVGVLTSGGDAPGMNAAIRAIVRVGLHRGLSVYGIRGGFQGIFQRDFVEMFARSVARIVHKGGTLLTTGRSDEFKTESGIRRAASILQEEHFDGLIAIGGDGTMRGLHELKKHWNGLTVGLPGSIDNDIYGTDYSIGFDTAVNNALDAIDKIRDTAESFSRVFLIEVMGRNCGAIALHVGIACGATAILIPETKTDLDAVARSVIDGRKAGKTSSIIIVAEGDEGGNAELIAEKLSSLVGERCRVSVLGYLQRGGNPTRYDRVLATRLGTRAVECMLHGVDGVMLGEVRGEVVATPFVDVWTKKKELDQWMLGLIDELAT